MFKKALSLLLALMLMVASFSVAMVTVAATDGDEAETASGLTVTATSNMFPEKTTSFTEEELSANDGLVTVTYFIQSEDRLLNADFMLTYDGSVLQFDEAANTTGSGRYAKLNVMPVASDAVINTNPGSVEYGVRGNCTNLTPYYLNAEDGGKTAFVTATFKVIGSGNTTVNLNVIDMRVTRLEDGQTQSSVENETQLIQDGVALADLPETSTEVYAGTFDPDYEEPQPTTEEETTEAPVEETTEAPVEETTEAPVEETTEAPVEETTEAPVEDTVIVAGSPADIFGTAWDATNEANTMTKAEDGTYTKDYTVNSTFNGVQLKVVVNGATWVGDKTGNNVTFNVTGAGTFTVIYHPATEGEDAYTEVVGDNVQFDTSLDYETVYAVGNGEGYWLNGAAWDPAFAANEMNKVAEDVWEIAFENVPDGFERQIKFAVDGAWTHNFGGAFEDSGVTSDAVYNGDNITFDTDATCTVKAQLDLSNFDYSTKEGAKFTITITYDEEETTEAPVEETTEAPVEETTEAPTTEAPVEETTEAPVEETTEAPAPAKDMFIVRAKSNFFPETAQGYSDFTEYEDENGDVFITVEYKMAAPGQYLINLDVDELTWDNTVLEFKEAYNTYGSGRNAAFSIFAFAVEQGRGAGMVNTFGDNNGGRIVGNYTSVKPAAYATDEDGESPVTVVRVKFKVIDKTIPRETVVNLSMQTLSLCDETVEEPYSQHVPVDNKVINDDAYKLGTYNTVINPEGEEVPVEETTEAPVEETTEAPVEETTEAPVEETTEAPVEETTEAPVEETTEAPVEETTEAPVEETTEAPVEETTEAPVDDTVIVAGSPADIFGTAWDGTNDANTMTKAEDGTYTKDYTVDSTFTGVQLKSVVNGATWVGDKTGNNVTFNVTEPGTFTVIYHPATEGEDAYTEVVGNNVQFDTSLDYQTVFAVGNGEGAWLNGAAWDPAYAANEMSQVADDVWEIEFKNVPDGFERQIKFAVDGAWTHNFGGAFEDSGVTSDAVYNGDNITFDTDATCTVKAQLDLSNFDYSTKEGAKFTITITYDEEETTEAPAVDALTVNGKSNYCAAVEGVTGEVGQSVTVTFKAPENADIVDIQWGMDYDKDLLQLTGISTIAPEQMLINANADSYNVLGNFADVNNPCAVYEGDDFITFVFTVKALGDNNSTDVVLTVVDMTIRTDEGDETIIINTVDQREEEEPTTEFGEETTVSPVEETTEAPVEETTEAPVEETTEAPVEETTEAPVEETTEAPVEETTEAPVEETTEAPVEETTEAPVEETTEAPVEETTGAPAEDTTSGEPSSDATSATDAETTTGTSTSDSGCTPDSTNNNAVQTGNASMALIILLVLVSATAGIYFARKKVK